MKVLVTGSEGLIGKELRELLLKRSVDVYAMDNKAPQGSDVKRLGHFPEFDVDVIYHLASEMGVKYVTANPQATTETTLKGIMNVVAWAQRHPVPPTILFTSTSEVYDIPSRGPGNPRWAYAQAKWMAEEYLRVSYPKSIIARIHNTTGPGQSTKFVLPRWIERAKRGEYLEVYDDGTQTRSFALAPAVAHILTQIVDKNLHGMTFDVGSPDEISMLDLARKVSFKYKCGYVLRPDEYDPVRSRGADLMALDRAGVDVSPLYLGINKVLEEMYR